MKHKTVVALTIIATAGGLLTPVREADAGMLRGGRLAQGRILGGLQPRPMLQPTAPMRGPNGLAAAPRQGRVWVTVGFFETKPPARPPAAGGYDYPGRYAGRFDGIDPAQGAGRTGASRAQTVGSNQTLTVGSNRTERIGQSMAPIYGPFEPSFRGGVFVAYPGANAPHGGQSSSYIRMSQPYAGTSARVRPVARTWAWLARRPR